MIKKISSRMVLLMGILVFLPSLVFAIPGAPCIDNNDCDATEECGPPTVSDEETTFGGECVQVASVGEATPRGATGSSGGLIIAECQGDAGITENCRDVNLILKQGIKIGQYLFSIIGGVALFFFVLGGYTIIMSMGSAEKAKKGTQMVLNAVIGMFIAFAAYLIIYFVLEALGVAEEFRGIQAP